MENRVRESEKLREKQRKGMWKWCVNVEWKITMGIYKGKQSKYEYEHSSKLYWYSALNIKFVSKPDPIHTWAIGFVPGLICNGGG